MADPSTRYRLRAGILAQTETIPMWGGVGVYANIPGGDPANLTQPNVALGAIVGRALALTGASKLVGFSVFDEAYGMVTSPQSPVPLAATSWTRFAGSARRTNRLYAIRRHPWPIGSGCVASALWTHFTIRRKEACRAWLRRSMDVTRLSTSTPPPLGLA